METTTWLLFGAMKLDDIKNFIGGNGIGILVFFMFIAVVIFTIYLCYCKFSGDASTSDKQTGENIMKYKKSLACLYMLFFFFLGSIIITNILLPSTKQALALITIDLTLKNNDSIVSTGQDVLELVDEKVEKYLRIMTNSELPVSVDKVKDIVSNTGDSLKKGTDTTKKVLREANKEVKDLVATAKELKELIE